jgi:hypothetical protein
MPRKITITDSLSYDEFCRDLAEKKQTSPSSTSLGLFGFSHGQLKGICVFTWSPVNMGTGQQSSSIEFIFTDRNDLIEPLQRRTEEWLKFLRFKDSSMMRYPYVTHCSFPHLGPEHIKNSETSAKAAIIQQLGKLTPKMLVDAFETVIRDYKIYETQDFPSANDLFTRLEHLRNGEATLWPSVLPPTVVF